MEGVVGGWRGWRGVAVWRFEGVWRGLEVREVLVGRVLGVWRFVSLGFGFLFCLPGNRYTLIGMFDEEFWSRNPFL